MFLIVENGDIYTPEQRGVSSLLAVSGQTATIGDVSRSAIEATGLRVEVVDATDCHVLPGLIDPHEHLLGGSGESGWASQTPELVLREIVTAGITTVVGCLGTDAVTKTMPGLLAKVKAFNDEGVTAFAWAGGYNVPPVTLTGSVDTDMLYVQEVIGAGEIAIADARSSAPSVQEIAKIVKAVYVAGTLTGKAGVTHFHTGDQPRRLADIRALLEDFEVLPDSVYPTHIERSDDLIREAADLTRRGVTVDADNIEHDLPDVFRSFLAHGGNPERFTASSDAGSSSPSDLLDGLRACIRDSHIGLERILPCLTSNTARVLRLPHKGSLRPGADADLVILHRESLELREVIARGRRLVKSGKLAFQERFLEASNRKVEFHGDKT